MIPAALFLIGAIVATMITEVLAYQIITAVALPSLYVIFLFLYYEIKSQRQVQQE